jgi:glutathione S-transferase
VFIQHMLEYAGANYENAEYDEVADLKSCAIPDQPVPCMAPPILHDVPNDCTLSQMPAIVVYLAGELGLAAGDAYLNYQALKVILDCNDVLSDITNANGSRMWTHDHWQVFRSNRLPRWLEIFEETGRRHGLSASSGFLLGTESASHADIAVAALFGTMARCLPALEKDIQSNAPALYGLCHRIEQCEGIRAAIKRQEAETGSTYCGGQIEQSIRKMLALDEAPGQV